MNLYLPEPFSSLVPRHSLAPHRTQHHTLIRLTCTDKSYYGEDADIFRPERWLDEKRPIGPPYHFSFGAGSRACTGIAISHRVLYISFARLLLHFKVLPAADGSLLDAHYARFNADTTQQTAHPHAYKIRLEPRLPAKEAADLRERCFEVSRATGEKMIYN